MNLCQNQCEGGRKPCPCPQACEVSEEELDHAIAIRLIWGILLATAIAAAVLLFV